MLWMAGGAHAAGQTILVLGDSLSAAYGIAVERGWVALLAKRLVNERLDYRVVNASISGETSGGGRARIGAVLREQRPAILILEFGANDGLRGLPIAAMKANLGEIIAEAQASGARVLLVGMRLPPNYGPRYTSAFETAYAELARRYRTAFVPFLMEDFAADRSLFQADGLHPTEAAQPQMLERVWRALRPLLRSAPR